MLSGITLVAARMPWSAQQQLRWLPRSWLRQKAKINPKCGAILFSLPSARVSGLCSYYLLYYKATPHHKAPYKLLLTFKSWVVLRAPPLSWNLYALITRAAISYQVLELELELTQTQMTQKPMLRAEGQKGSAHA